MATQPPNTADRNANLDELQQAVTDWTRKELERLDNEAAFLRSVLNGRGAASAGVTNVGNMSTLVQSEVDAFLGGS
jgi:uridine phosphorylase